ncbi:hypothetical protein [Alienimonas chondri]|uniref:Uncharacterized protein n=1 Tax=Alienimonas chondri TaxID=2681879 RepID=A0ABX1VM40_9PLAN|nr:hypothetical protein [Alienimonas chondri]NNJ28007.1 hypothetical protein [Alienimonas chondri]
MKAIAEGTGNRLDWSAIPAAMLAEPAPDLSALADDDGAATFWEVLNALSPGRFAVGDVQDHSLILLPAADQTAAATADGVLRIEVGPATPRPRFGSDETLLRLPVRMIAEPRVQPLAILPRGGGLTASAAGTALTSFTPAASREVSFANGTATFEVDFFAPPAAPAALTVDGTFEITFIPGRRTFVFEPTDAGQSRTVDGLTVRFEDLKQTADGVTASAAVLYDADGGGLAFESYRTWRYDAAVRLRTANGTRLEPTVPPRIVSEGAAAIAVKAGFAPALDERAAMRVEIIAPAAPETAAVRWKNLPVEAVPPPLDANPKPSEKAP